MPPTYELYQFFTSPTLFPVAYIPSVALYWRKHWATYLTTIFPDWWNQEHLCSQQELYECEELLSTFLETISCEIWQTTRKQCEQDYHYLGVVPSWSIKPFDFEWSGKRHLLSFTCVAYVHKDLAEQEIEIVSLPSSHDTVSSHVFLSVSTNESSLSVQSCVQEIFASEYWTSNDVPADVSERLQWHLQSESSLEDQVSYSIPNSSQLLEKLWSHWLGERAVSILGDDTYSKDHIAQLQEAMRRLVDVLRQLESEIQKLWDIKKPLRSQRWIVPSGALGPPWLEALVSIDALWEDWEALSLVESAQVSSSDERMEYLRNHSGLPVDTSYLSTYQVYQLLSSCNLKELHYEVCIVAADNEQMLRSFKALYATSVGCCYIDPPYNTSFHEKSSRMSYHDSLDREIWFSFMKSRLSAAEPYFTSQAALFASIDEKELAALLRLVEESVLEYQGVFTWRRTRTGGHLSQSFNQLSDFVVVATSNQTTPLFGGMADPSESQPLTKASNRVIELEFPAGSITFLDIEQGELQQGAKGRGRVPVTLVEKVPIADHTNVNRCCLRGPFVWTQSTLEDEVRLGARFIVKRSKSLCPRFLRTPRRHKPFPSLPGPRFDVGTNEDGSQRLLDLFGKRTMHTYPKPVSLVKRCIESRSHFTPDTVILDYFAGSGTTAEAVMEMNRQDGTRLHGVVVETEDTCTRLILPRLKKLLYSSKWKQGKPDKVDSRPVSYFSYASLEPVAAFAERLYLQKDSKIEDLCGKNLLHHEMGSAIIETAHCHLGIHCNRYYLEGDCLCIEGNTSDQKSVLLVWGIDTVACCQVLQSRYSEDELSGFALRYAQSVEELGGVVFQPLRAVIERFHFYK